MRAVWLRLRCRDKYHEMEGMATPRKNGQTRKALGIATAETAGSAVFASLAQGPLMTGFLLAWGATDVQLGFFASLPSLVAFTELIAAYQIDRRAHRRRLFVATAGLIARGIFFLSAALAWCAGFSAAWFLPLFFGLYAVFQAFYHASGPGWTAWMAVLVPPQIRGRYLGVRNRVVDATGLVALVLAGAALDVFREAGLERQGFSLLHGIAGMAGVVCFLLLIRQYDPGHSSRPPQLKWNYLLASLRDVRFRSLAAVNLIWLAGLTVYMPFAEAHVIKKMQWSFKSISALVIVSTLSAVLASRHWGKLSDRIGARRVMGVCMAGLLCVPALLYVCPVDHIWLVYGCWGVMGLFTSGYGLTMFSLTLECLPADSRTMGAALLATLAAPVVAGAGLLAGWGAELSGSYDLLFIASIVLRLPAFLFLRRL